MTTPDFFTSADNWSNLLNYCEPPQIDFGKLHGYRINRIRAELGKNDAAMCVLVNPISLRYAVGYRSYALFQSHIPTTYLFVPREGPLVIHGLYGALPKVDEVRDNRAISFFDGGPEIGDSSRLLANDIKNFLTEIGTNNRRVAVEHINPSVTRSLMQIGLEPIDGVLVSEKARVIKSEDEIKCMKWAIKVAELGIAKLKEALKPGVSELQLWGLLNYTNLANNGDWHDGRMLASGSRINPWLQEASPRKVESGDLVGFDTDMIGPFGYFADISRTFHCGPQKPSKRQKQVYRLAAAEIDHNLKLVKPGTTFAEFQRQAFQVPEEYRKNAYTCIVHAVGMCDEYPRINPPFRGPNPYNGIIAPGMVLCIESYMGAEGETGIGVKLEQQVLVTESGCELLSNYPLEESLME
ncbi:MAG: Xaa-Pro peptidase family protein [Roseovarius sp.]|nr:Xaa-Pro peptidase family protein [Roseovarius sp.]